MTYKSVNEPKKLSTYKLGLILNSNLIETFKHEHGLVKIGCIYDISWFLDGD